MTLPLTVQSHRGPYDVRFSLNFAEDLSKELRPGDVLLIDDNVATLHAPRLRQFLHGYSCHLLHATEEAKSYQAIAPLIERLIESGFRKSHRLVAIGGGIVQDITAFTASILYRGVSWIFVPTNLVTQADSCIGSKTSINIGGYKNQIGGFHPPSLVINDQSLLETLSRDDLRSGMGEILHYVLLDGREAFDLVRAQYERAFDDRVVLSELIHRSLGIKQKVIEQDEFDLGPRRVFNYGHSFGHALESYTSYTVPHGIAVTFGMDLANYISVARGLLGQAECDEMHELLERNFRPTLLDRVDVQTYFELLRKDKKNTAHDVRVVLTRGIGKMFLTTLTLDGTVSEVLRERFAYYSRPTGTA